MQNSSFKYKKYLIPYPYLGFCATGNVIAHHLLSQRFAALLNLALITDPKIQELKDLAACYYLPNQILLQDQAIALGIYSLNDLYGGVVPYEFLKDKSLTHPIYHISMNRPEGWNNQLGVYLKPYVLDGFSAFTTQDVLWAAQGMIDSGPIRLKLASTTSEQSHWVFSHHAEFIKFINQMQDHPLFKQGMVVEEDLRNTTTFSIGQTEIGGLLISYCGEHVLTTNLNGEKTYGGANLFVVRGNYNQLHDALTFPIHREALHLTRQYEQLIFETFPLLYASRRNYTVLYGVNAKRQVRLGVLKPSWCMGNTSMAELLALEAFCATPKLKSINTWTRDHYVETFSCLTSSELAHDLDESPVGFIVKYAGVDDVSLTNPYSIEKIINAHEFLK